MPRARHYRVFYVVEDVGENGCGHQHKNVEQAFNCMGNSNRKDPPFRVVRVLRKSDPDSKGNVIVSRTVVL